MTPTYADDHIIDQGAREPSSRPSRVRGKACRHPLRLGSQPRAGARLGLLAATLALALWLSPSAQAATCSLADQDYNGACGPQFELPAWGDGAGWTDPSKYSTIQLADLTGNGVDELIARNDDGIEIWRFDTAVGQWRPAIGADGQPEMLTDFHSPGPSEPGPNWNQPQYYSTIQTVNLDGPGHGADIIARFPSGIRVYHYTPPAGTNDINGGTWKLPAQNGPFSDADGYTDPSLYLTIHGLAASGTQPGWLLAQKKGGTIVGYAWTGSGWVDRLELNTNLQSSPQYYLNTLPASLVSGSAAAPAFIFRDASGINAYTASDLVRLAPNGPRVFGDATGFGSSPSYYETLRLAKITGGTGDELLGRTSTGLAAYKLSGGQWQPLAALTDLKGSAQSLKDTPGRWSSIRVGDVLGNGRDQVLALDGTALQAWGYDPASNSWARLGSAAPLGVGGKLWDTNPSYYSTIEVGDVTGSGHDAVIARGPYGIRTWFYNLHGNSGWTSYLPQDASSYRQFSGGAAAALAALNSQARSHGAIPGGDSSVRDVWTGENAPSAAVLNTLQLAILSFAGCSGGTDGNPPFSQCAPPAGSVGFTVADWTQVINQVLGEIQSVRDADDFFSELQSVRGNTFIQERSDLDAIIGRLGLPGAAATETTVSPGEIAAAVLKIIGSAVGAIPVAGHLLAAPLEIAGEVTGLLASESPTLNSTFQTTVVGLNEKFATMVDEILKGLEVQSQEVRQSYGMLTLLAQLTTGAGPWSSIDKVGMESANEQGFATWAYQQLLPSIYARYDIKRCYGPKFGCYFSAPGLGTVVNHCVKCYTVIGPAPQAGGPFSDGAPCETRLFHELNGCRFTQLGEVDPTLATRIWGPVSEACNYQPGEANTKWVFGCNLGISPASSTSLTNGPANGWNFANYCYDNDVEWESIQACQGASASATVGQDGHVVLSGRMTLPAGFNVKSATIVRNRLLYEPAGRDGAAVEVVERAPGRALGPVRLASQAGPGVFASAALGVRARLELGPASAGQHSYDLTLSGVDVGVPNACQALAASQSLNTPPFELTSTLLLSDGARRQTAVIPALWRCVRNNSATISELQPVEHQSRSQRPGLTLSLAGPRAVTAGSTVTFSLRVRNRRRGSGSPLVSGLWHLVVQGGAGTVAVGEIGGADRVLQRAIWRIGELAGGESRVLSLRVAVPDYPAIKLCVAADATADSARPAAAGRCSRVDPRPPTPVTGLG